MITMSIIKIHWEAIAVVVLINIREFVLIRNNMILNSHEPHHVHLIN